MKTDYEKETEREIEHDKNPMRGKRKRGGTASGERARTRHDRSRRQMGGIPARPGMGAAPAVGGMPVGPGGMPAGVVPPGVMPPMQSGVPASVMPRPVGAAAPAALATRPTGFERGGRTNGEKWVPGLGVERTATQDRSRGDPVLEGKRDYNPREMKKGGRLTAHERQSMPKSEFALPGKGAGPKGAGAGSYPIPNESHARNALARVSQHGSSAEKAKVRAKVHAKYPSIDIGGE